MVRCCVAPNCKTIYMKDSDIKLHEFPVDPKRRNQWVEAMNRENFVPGKHSSLCSKHFEDKCYYISNNRRLLRKDAIPSIFNIPTRTLPTSLDGLAILFVEASYNEPPVSSLENIINENYENKLKRPLSIESSGRINEVRENDSASSSPPVSAEHLMKRHKTDDLSPSHKPKVQTQLCSSVDGVKPLLPKINDIKSDPIQTSSTLSASKVQFETNRSEADHRNKNPQYRVPKSIGDCHSEDMVSPKKALRNFRIPKQQLNKLRKSFKSVHQRRKPLQYRINNLTSLMKELKRKYDISESSETAILASLPDSGKAIFETVLKGSKGCQYTPQLRSFALTLHFYSSKAYSYVRETFYKSLPHPSTITKWFQSVNGEPGFTAEAINALKIKVAEAALKNKKVFCNLLLDEMYIRTKEIWTGKEYKGHVNIGTTFTGDVELATQALVFMLVAVNGSWKIPVGYFLLNGLQSNEKANLLTKCLEFVHQSGVEVLAVTFDGAPVNIMMASKLGASLVDPACGVLNTTFEHPVTRKPVCIILDTCHMLKLIRNCLASVKEIQHESGTTIRWTYFENLCNLQEKEGITLRRTAAQTFTRSVADAMDLKLSEFQGCEETVKFCRLVNDIFDIFNSRNYLCKYKYKKRLDLETSEFIFKKFEECKTYFSKLKINNVPILQSQRKTGFLGILVAIESATIIFKNLVNCPQPLLDFLLLHKFSQDHLEIFFSAIKSKGGFNDNLNALQFEEAYKRLIIKNASTSVLYAGSQSLQISQLGEKLNDEYRTVIHETDHDYIPSQAWHLTVYQNDVVAYIAGFIIKRLKKSISCDKCLIELETEESHSSLQERKVYGKLNNASSFVVTICRMGEKSYRLAESLSQLKQKNIIDYLTVNTISIIPNNVFDNFSLSHLLEDEILNNHSIQLTKIILHHYFNLRIHHTVNGYEDMKQRFLSKFTKQS